MRVVGLWAVGAGLLVALTGPPGPHGERAAVPAANPARESSLLERVLGEHPAIWRDARVVRGREVVVAGAAGTALDLGDIARRADHAAHTVRRIVGPRPSAGEPGRTPGAGRSGGSAWRGAGVAPAGEPVVILVPASTEQAATLAAPAAVGGMAALAGTDHVIVEPRAFAMLTEAGRDVVLAHELTHLPMGAATDGRTPKWLIEGFADYAGYLNADIPVRAAAAELATEVRAGRVPTALPAPEDFSGTRPGGGAARAYEQAWLACRYIAHRYGEPRLRAFYHAASHDDLDTALTSTLGLTRASFMTAWRAYLRAELS